MHRPCVMSAERLLQHASRRALVLHQVHTIGLEGEGVGGASIRIFYCMRRSQSGGINV